MNEPRATHPLDRMQFGHHRIHIPGTQQIDVVEHAMDRPKNQSLIRRIRLCQDVIRGRPRIRRPPDSEPQAQKPRTTQYGNNVPKSVVPSVPAPKLESRDARVEIQFVVSHEDLISHDLQKPRDRPNRMSAAVHEGHGLDQMDGLPPRLRGSDIGLPAGFVSESHAQSSSPFVHEPKPGVVPGLAVLTARVSQPDHQPQWSVRDHRADGYYSGTSSVTSPLRGG